MTTKALEKVKSSESKTFPIIFIRSFSWKKKMECKIRLY